MFFRLYHLHLNVTLARKPEFQKCRQQSIKGVRIFAFLIIRCPRGEDWGIGTLGPSLESLERERVRSETTVGTLHSSKNAVLSWWRLYERTVSKIRRDLDSWPRTPSPRLTPSLWWQGPDLRANSVSTDHSGGLASVLVQQDTCLLKGSIKTKTTKSKSPRLDPINVWNTLQCYQDEKEIKGIKVRDWHGRKDLTLPPDQKTERVQHQK